MLLKERYTSHEGEGLPSDRMERAGSGRALHRRDRNVAPAGWTSAAQTVACRRSDHHHCVRPDPTRPESKRDSIKPNPASSQGGVCTNRDRAVEQEAYLTLPPVADRATV